MISTIHCKLLAKKSGIYTVYVFQEDNGNLCMCTQLPNWGVYNININDTGFLTYETAIAGEKYFERESQVEKTYQFTNIYFKDFIKDNKNQEQIIL